MLILTRRPQQTFVIGSDIVITVMEIRGGQVRIGVAAPGDVTILRGELLDQNPDARQIAGASS